MSQLFSKRITSNLERSISLMEKRTLVGTQIRDCLSSFSSNLKHLPKSERLNMWDREDFALER
jgi:hypothetical protein